jgi:hypothetical protein
MWRLSCAVCAPLPPDPDPLLLLLLLCMHAGDTATCGDTRQPRQLLPLPLLAWAKPSSAPLLLLPG